MSVYALLYFIVCTVLINKHFTFVLPHYLIQYSGSCLHGAAVRGNTVIVQRLLNNNWNIHAVDKVSYSWLCL